MNQPVESQRLCSTNAASSLFCLSKGNKDEEILHLLVQLEKGSDWLQQRCVAAVYPQWRCILTGSLWPTYCAIGCLLLHPKLKLLACPVQNTMRSQAPASGRDRREDPRVSQTWHRDGYSGQIQPWLLVHFTEPHVPQTYASAPETNAPKCRNAKEKTKKWNIWLIYSRSDERPGPQIVWFCCHYFQPFWRFCLQNHQTNGPGLRFNSLVKRSTIWSGFCPPSILPVPHRQPFPNDTLLHRAGDLLFSQKQEEHSHTNITWDCVPGGLSQTDRPICS